MFNYSHRSVTNLVCEQELMKLSEIWIRLEYVQKIESQLERLFIVVSECAGYCPKQGLML